MIVTVNKGGRQSAKTVPDHAPENTWAAGVHIGPPDLSDLGLSEEVTTRLNNELFSRGVIRKSDARAKRPEVVYALQAALRVDAERIISIYEEYGNA